MKNHMWKMIMKCLCVCIIVLLNAGVVRAESIVDNAELVSFGGSYRCNRGDEKAYKLVVTQSGIVTVNATSTEMDYLNFVMCDSATNGLDGEVKRESLNSVTGILRYVQQILGLVISSLMYRLHLRRRVKVFRIPMRMICLVVQMSLQLDKHMQVWWGLQIMLTSLR